MLQRQRRKPNSVVPDPKQINVCPKPPCKECSCMFKSSIKEISVKWYDNFFQHENVELTVIVPTFLCKKELFNWCSPKAFERAREKAIKEYLALQDLKENKNARIGR